MYSWFDCSKRGDLRFLLREGADEACAGEVLLGLRGDVGEHGLDALEARVNACAEVLHEHGREGQRHEREERQARAGADHVRQRRGGEDDGVGAVHDGRAEQLANGAEVVGRPRHDVAGAVLLEEAGRLRFEVREEVVAEVELDFARSSDDDLPLNVEERAGDGGDGDEFERGVGDRRGCQVVLHVVDGMADDDGHKRLGRVVDDEREEAPGEAPPVTAEVREQGAQALQHGTFSAAIKRLAGW